MSTADEEWPQTEDVRNAAADWMMHEADFDRWLAEHDREVAEATIRQHAEAVADTMRAEFQGAIVGLMAENTQLRGLLASVGGSLPQRITLGEATS